MTPRYWAVVVSGVSGVPGGSHMKDPAAISFTGDRPSALGDPRVVARGLFDAPFVK